MLNPVKYFYLISIILIITACSVLKKNATSGEKLSKEKSLSVFKQEEFDRKFLEANKQKLIENYEGAAKLFSECIQINPTSAVSNYELGVVYKKQGKQVESKIFLKQAFELNPLNEWYGKELGNLLLIKQGNLPEALGVYSKMKNLFPNELSYYLNEAYIYRKQNKVDKALETLNLAEKNIGPLPIIIEEKKQLYLAKNQLDNAAKELKKLAIASPNEAIYQLSIADLYLVNNKPDNALKYLEAAKTIDPNDGNVDLSYSAYYKSKKMYVESYESLKKVFKNPQMDVDRKSVILVEYLNILMKDSTATEFKKQAFELANIAKETHPTDARPYFIASDLYIKDNKLDLAQQNLKKGIQYDKTNFSAWNQLILLNSDFNQIDEMEKNAGEAITIFPNQAVLYLYQGSGLMQQKKYKEAVEVLKQGASITIENNALLSNFYSMIADCYHSLMENKLSDEYYEKVLKIEPKNINVLNNYAYYLSERGENLERAESMSKQSLDYEPGVASYLDTYAWILFKLKRYDQALDYQLKAISKSSPSAVMFEHLGDIYSMLGNAELALVNWNKALVLNGTNVMLNKKISDKKYSEK